MEDPVDRLTKLINAWFKGDRDVEADLWPVLTNELRKTAKRLLARERPDHTLQPTELVSEFYLRAKPRPGIDFPSRTVFFGYAATVLRNFLVDYARARRRRPDRSARADTDITVFVDKTYPNVDVLIVHDILTKLEAMDPRGARILELRFFVGLKRKEIAQTEGLSVATVDSDLKVCRAWMKQQLHRGGSNGPREVGKDQEDL